MDTGHWPSDIHNGTLYSRVFCLLIDRIMWIEIESDIKLALGSQVIHATTFAMTMKNDKNETKSIRSDSWTKWINKWKKNSLKMFVGFSSLNFIGFYISKSPVFYTVFVSCFRISLDGITFCLVIGSIYSLVVVQA